MTDYILLFISVILMVALFVTNKMFQQQAGTAMREGLIFNGSLGMILAVAFWGMNGFRLDINIYSAVMAVFVALLTVGYTMIGFRIMRNEKVALYTIFLMTGGMTIPYVWGLLFLDESYSWLRTIGLIVIIVSIILSNTDGKSGSRKHVLMCVAVFILNGFVSVLQKEHQINVNAVSTIDFIILNSLAKFLLCSVGLLFVKKKQEVKIKLSSKSVFIIVISAVFFGGSYILQLAGAKSLPATVLYPIVTGGGIIFSSVSGRIFFGEKITQRLLTGIILCFFGTCMFL